MLLHVQRINTLKVIKNEDESSPCRAPASPSPRPEFEPVSGCAAARRALVDDRKRIFSSRLPSDVDSMGNVG